MVRFITASIVILMLFQTLRAQLYTLWMKHYGDDLFSSFNSIGRTSDSGLVAIGRTQRLFGLNNMDTWVVKTDAWGDTLWRNKIGNIF